MRSAFFRTIALTLASSAASLVAGCGQPNTSGRSASEVLIVRLEAARGDDAQTLSGTLNSDVVTIVDGTPTIFNDVARVILRLVLRDPGSPGVTNVPSDLNAVQITRYRVEYVRADGRNRPGVDVPHPFDGALTFLVQGDADEGNFEIVRHIAKQEAPLAALADSPVIISTITRVTFFGKDVAGHDVAVTGQMLINFGNFADPD